MEMLILLAASIAGVAVVGAAVHLLERDLERRRAKMQEYFAMYKDSIEHQVLREQPVPHATGI